MQVARIYGSAGAGKTTALMEIIEKLLDSGVPADQIGFSSFTRAARIEAVERMCSKFGINREWMLENGFFKTVHALAYQFIRPAHLITGTKSDQEWLSAIFGDERHIVTKVDDGLLGDLSEAGAALNLWGAYRLCLGYPRMADIPLHGGIDWHKMLPFAQWLDARGYDVDIQGALHHVQKYETHRTIDNMDDFTSLIGRYAGVVFHPTQPPAETYPEGDTPGVQAWMQDEMQDASPLLDIAFRRLANSPGCRFTYICGDEFQAIYGWAGSSSRCFKGWDVQKERVLPKSYRCKHEIFHFAEAILRECSDYWQRPVDPAGPGGSVEFYRYGIASILQQVHPDDEWLVLARTVREAGILLARLRTAFPEYHIGWASRENEQHGRERRAAIALWRLRHSQRVSTDEWSDVVHTVPSALGYFKRGMRKRLEDPLYLDKVGDMDIQRIMGEADDPFAAETAVAVSAEDAGFTETLAPALLDDSWAALFGEKMEADLVRLDKGGIDVFERPDVRVGTIHSAKGMEAENVAWLATETRAIQRGCQDNPEIADEERRVQYVAATRAKTRLVVALPPAGRMPTLPM